MSSSNWSPKEILATIDTGPPVHPAVRKVLDSIGDDGTAAGNSDVLELYEIASTMLPGDSFETAKVRYEAIRAVLDGVGERPQWMVEIFRQLDGLPPLIPETATPPCASEPEPESKAPAPLPEAVAVVPPAPVVAEKPLTRLTFLGLPEAERLRWTSENLEWVRRMTAELRHEREQRAEVVE
ncbi:MAG: hypothetical protein KDA75_16290 [Planctomycetaceae bacterium]|nr:hypothetical protein [Planctomycetaceae bacterium]